MYPEPMAVVAHSFAGALAGVFVGALAEAFAGALVEAFATYASVLPSGGCGGLTVTTRTTAGDTLATIAATASRSVSARAIRGASDTSNSGNTIARA